MCLSLSQAPWPDRTLAITDLHFPLQPAMCIISSIFFPNILKCLPDMWAFVFHDPSSFWFFLWGKPFSIFAVVISRLQIEEACFFLSSPIYFHWRCNPSMRYAETIDRTTSQQHQASFPWFLRWTNTHCHMLRHRTHCSLDVGHYFVNGAFARTILFLMSSSHLPLDTTLLPRWLKLYTCLFLLPWVDILHVGVVFFLLMIMHYVFLMLIHRPSHCFHLL